MSKSKIETALEYPGMNSDDAASASTSRDKIMNANCHEWNLEPLSVSSGKRNVEYMSQLSKAFKQDCEEFLLDFATHKSYTFEKFAETWRKFSFTQVLEGEEDEECLVTFLEDCFFQLKKYVIFSKNMYIQVGAVFMLYSLYYKQPTRGLVKIRWTFKEYSAVLKFLEQAKTHSKDVVDNFHRMKLSNAFLYVAETRRWGIEPKYAHQEKQLENDIFGHDVNLETVKSEIFSSDFFGVSNLEAVQKEYQEGLAEYLNEHPEYKAESSFHKSTLAEDLKKNFEEFELTTNKEDEISVDEAIGNTRKTIKSKAFQKEINKFRE